MHSPVHQLLRLAIGLAAAAVSYAQPTIDKVDPPNWWPGHTLNPVRVLIHGQNLTAASVTVPAGLTASNVRVNPVGTYLFVDLSIPLDAQPGSYPLHVKTAQGTALAPFTLEAPLAPEGRFQGFSSDDVIYEIMPDRFSNGDPANDNPKISSGLFDRANPRMYHGGDLQGIINHLPYIKSLGATALWLTPVYDNTNQPNRVQAIGTHPVSDYHGYGAVDYYSVEEHFGTVDKLRQLVDAAHHLGLKVIQDQVANHVGPQHPWATDPPDPTWFHGTPAHHTDETWQIWSLPDPHASEKQRSDVLNGWFANVLPDLNQEDPDVAQYEIQNALWWVAITGFDGIRQDTLPYVPRSFWHDWAAALHRQYPRLRIVGEVLDPGDPSPGLTSFFQAGANRSDGAGISVDSGIDSVLDYPIYFRIRDVFAKGAHIDRLAQILAEDWLYPHPELLVAFAGNHDMPRFLNTPGATPQRLKLAETFLLTMRGVPQIYYGDEIGMTGGDDPDNRRDFPGGWPEDSRSAFESSARTPAENSLVEHLQKLTHLRNELEPLRRGAMRSIAITESTWAYARTSSTGSILIVINNGPTAAEVCVPWQTDGALRGRLGLVPELRVTRGKATVSLPPESGEIFTVP